MKKKGSMSLEKTAGLILLVVAFAIILFFIAGFDFFDEMDKQKCHESVVYKATVPDVGPVEPDIIPLDCETEKICVIAPGLFSSDNCDEEYAGEEYQIVKLTGEKKEWEEEVTKIIAEKMHECWWMMGQGKLKVYSRKLPTKKYCNICTRINFGKELQEELEEVTEIKRYMATHYPTGSDETYWQYITNSESNYIYDYDEETDKIKTTPQAILFMETDKSNFVKWITIGGAGYIGAVVGSVVPGGGFIGVGIGGSIGKEYSDKVDNFFNKEIRLSSITLSEYNAEALKEWECTSFEVS